jgi:hypothetical protein
VLEKSKKRSLLAETSLGLFSASLEQYRQKDSPEREAQEETIEHTALERWLDRFRAPAYSGIVADASPQPL